MVDVAIIGAGPYGLSIAAHLKARGVNFRIFGSPMSMWREHMPKGMLLKSEGFASSLYDPSSSFPLARYCKENQLAYADLGLPVPLETFCSYGLEFQRRFVPELENKQVEHIDRQANGFRIRLSDESVVIARRVVSAVGLSSFDYVPPELAGLPGEFLTHSSRHSVLDEFKGRRVIVVGAGASALDLAALLHEAGSCVQVVARAPLIRFHDRGATKRSLSQRIRNPSTGLGPGWASLVCVKAPLAFRKLPEQLRLEFVKKHLGPAPGWFVRDQVVGKVPLNVGMSIKSATVESQSVRLEVSDAGGSNRALFADHVIAATGYKVDVRRLKFLSSGVLAGIRTVNNTPILSSNFESSVPGLYFVGITAANTFGPLLRFAFGARFASRRLLKHFTRSASYAATEY